MDSGALPTQASMILWFFRGRQRPALRENKQTTKVVEENSSLRHILVPVWTEVFPRRFLFGRSHCHPAWFFGFFFFRNMERWTQKQLGSRSRDLLFSETDEEIYYMFFRTTRKDIFIMANSPGCPFRKNDVFLSR